VKVLVVDDERLARHLLRGFLTRDGYQVVEAVNGAEALRVLQTQQIRFVITDWMMPELNGLELIRALRRDGAAHLIYIILLTAKEHGSELVEAMDAGADDFIRKPFDREELRARVRAGERILQLTERLERQARTDPLTGLLNRRGLHEAIAEHMLDEDCGAGLGFVIADLDHFKRVNDTYGHACGDRVLTQTGALLRMGFEPGGLVARIGGEEFWVLLGDCDRSGLGRRAQTARELIAGTPFPVGAAQPLHLTASFGCTWTAALDDRRIEDLYRIADAALYRSKNAGRNRVTCIAGEAED
jgi:two-component system chemotaxis response regulator CheY